MNLQFDAADDVFRQEVRDFLKENLPADLAAQVRTTFHVTREMSRRWTKILHAAGWSAPNWPVEHGGTGWEPMKQFIFEEECFLADAPTLDIGGLKLIGPVIYTFGSDDLKERFLKPFLRGELSWAQGFSEPNAGSDLASLSTRAVRDGDEYVVSGRKIWTSNAHQADFIFCLVKTDPEARQRGISFLLIDARAPGVTVRPIIDLGGGHSLNEVFLDDVRVPAANLVGEENKGWTYAKFLLENERAFSAEVPRNKRYLQTLKTIARSTKREGRALVDDPAFAARIAAAEAELAALEFVTLRALTEKKGESRLPVGSILHVRGSELLQRLTEMHIEALGDHGLYTHGEYADPAGLPIPPFAYGLLADSLYRRASTIYGGSNEIQRTVIARQYLELG